MTLNGGLGFSSGLVGQAFDFHMNNSQYAAGAEDDAAFDFGTSDFTIQVWANFNSFAAGEQTLFEKFTGPGGDGWTLTQRSGPSLHYFVNGNVILETGFGIPIVGFMTSAWHDIVVRRSGNLFTLFFDGMAIETNSGPNPNINTDQPLRIGNRQGPQSFPMDGRIDEAAIWNRALTNAEITTLFNATVPEPSALLLVALALAPIARSHYGATKSLRANQQRFWTHVPGQLNPRS